MSVNSRGERLFIKRGPDIDFVILFDSDVIEPKNLQRSEEAIGRRAIPIVVESTERLRKDNETAKAGIQHSDELIAFCLDSTDPGEWFPD